MAQKDKPAALNKQKDVVSEDRNWVLRINNQVGSEKTWDKQWGYLSGGFSPQKISIKDSLDQKIQQLQEEIKSMDKKTVFSTTSEIYGQGQNVELFKNNNYAIKEGKDLRALQRKLPKGWKKAKWTPPVDPFDPIANMYKKKK